VEGGPGETYGGYLPPEPPGPEPDLDARPPEPKRQPAEQGPPNAGFPTGAPPQQPWPHVQPPQPTWQPSAGAGQPPPAAGWPAYGWGYPARPAEPENRPAVAGFVLAMVSLGLLVLSAGLSSIVSIGCGIAGIALSRAGRRKVRDGETTRNAGLAQAGFICGIVATILSSIATVFWLLILILGLAGVLDGDTSGGSGTDGIESTVIVARTLLQFALG
jgi:hypothetical protein